MYPCNGFSPADVLPVCFIYLLRHLGRGAGYFDEHICLSVYLFTHISQKPHGRTSLYFLCMLPADVVSSSSGSIAICFVCTSGFEDGVMFFVFICIPK